MPALGRRGPKPSLAWRCHWGAELPSFPAEGHVHCPDLGCSDQWAADGGKSVVGAVSVACKALAGRAAPAMAPPWHMADVRRSLAGRSGLPLSFSERGDGHLAAWPSPKELPVSLAVKVKVAAIVGLAVVDRFVPLSQNQSASRAGTPPLAAPGARSLEGLALSLSAACAGGCPTHNRRMTTAPLPSAGNLFTSCQDSNRWHCRASALTSRLCRRALR